MSSDEFNSVIVLLTAISDNMGRFVDRLGKQNELLGVIVDRINAIDDRLDDFDDFDDFDDEPGRDPDGRPDIPAAFARRNFASAN